MSFATFLQKWYGSCTFRNTFQWVAFTQMDVNLAVFYVQNKPRGYCERKRKKSLYQSILCSSNYNLWEKK